MARKRPGVVAVRRLVAVMFLFVGLFVICFGLGNGSQTVMVAGAAIMVLAFTARIATSFRRTPRQWLRGVGLVLEVSEPPADAPLARCSLQLLLNVPDLPEEAVLVHDARVPVAQWPKPGQEVPIQVAADDIRNVRVLWRDFTATDLPLDAAFNDDQPVPAPAIPPGSHLDPSPVVDFDLDHPIPAALEPMAPTAPRSEPGPTMAPGPAAAEQSPADEGRLDRDTPLAEQPPPTPPPGPSAGGEQGPLATVVAPAMVPRPRPSPRPRHQPAPAATAPPDPKEDLLTIYPSAHPGPAGAINGVGLTMLVSELARSVAFYRDRLGFHEVDQGEGTSVLASGETRLVLRQARELSAVKHRPVHLNLEVSDIDEVFAQLKADGVRFTYPPRPVNETARLQLWAAAFRDPDGHGIALTQWRPALRPEPAAADSEVDS